MLAANVYVGVKFCQRLGIKFPEETFPEETRLGGNLHRNCAKDRTRWCICCACLHILWLRNWSSAKIIYSSCHAHNMDGPNKTLHLRILIIAPSFSVTKTVDHGGSGACSPPDSSTSKAVSFVDNGGSPFSPVLPWGHLCVYPSVLHHSVVTSSHTLCCSTLSPLHGVHGVMRKTEFCFFVFGDFATKPDQLLTPAPDSTLPRFDMLSVSNFISENQNSKFRFSDVSDGSLRTCLKNCFL